MHTRLVCTLSSVLALSSPAASFADDGDAHERWYGWQTLVADGLALGVAGLGLGLDAGDTSTTVLSLAATGYVLGGPLVHLGHGDAMKGLGSLGLRVGAPLVSGVVFGALFAGTANHAMSGFQAGFYFIGVPVGVVTAIIVDAAVLAWEPATPSSTGIGVDLSRDRVGLAVSGRF